MGPPIGSSDHSTVTFKLRWEMERNMSIWRRDFNTADYDKIKQHLADVDRIGTLTALETANEQHEAFLAVLHHVIDLYVPMREINPGNLKIPNYLERMNRHRSLLWDKASKSMDSNAWTDYVAFNRKVDKAFSRYNLYTEKKF